VIGFDKGNSDIGLNIPLLGSKQCANAGAASFDISTRPQGGSQEFRNTPQQRRAVITEPLSPQPVKSMDVPPR
jgi:hypothetical protein